ncbi:MAG: prephenate dehydrogenase [Flexilinea sp.]
MNIGIVGLGLIGGSMAKAIKTHTEHTVLGMDLIESVVYKAYLLEAIDGQLTTEKLKDCDIVFLAMYPQDTIDFVKANADLFKKNGLVLDLCGVKEVVCTPILPMARENGFIYIGAHPMAGREFSGFSHSSGSLFEGASMVLVPFHGTTIETVQSVKELCKRIGFTCIQISTPEEHDRMIAFTSQLAHVVSSAYIKSPTALEQIGFSAGSFKDMTRVAKLNEKMWTELFLDNPDHLCEEIELLIQHLQEYKEAIRDGDRDRLFNLLKEGRELKAVVDGEVLDDK